MFLKLIKCDVILANKIIVIITREIPLFYL